MLVRNTLCASILEKLAENPECTAIEYNQVEIKNKHLLNKIISFSGKLKEYGITPGMRVGVLMHRSPDSLTCLLALWQLSAIYIPLDPEFPKIRLEYICEDAKLEVVITQAALQNCLSGLIVKQLIIQAIDYSAEVTNNKIEISGDTRATAYILYTSGSSGQPKGVEISQDNLSALFNSIVPLLKIESHETFLGIAHFSFDIALFELLCPLLTCGKLILLDSADYKNPEIIAATISLKKVTIVQATPSLWSLINHYSWNKAGRKILTISTGEALPVKLANDILKNEVTLWNLYGPTECTIWVTAKLVSQQVHDVKKNKYISIGCAIPGCKIFLSHKKHTESLGIRGELYISGPGLALGYYNKAGLSEKYFKLDKNNRRYYLSGDICSWGNNNELYFHGRKDSQVKVNGYRIELEEIEFSLEQSLYIEQALVSVQKSSNTNVTVLLAFIVYTKGAPNKTSVTINEMLSQRLPAYMLPQRYFFVESLPLTSNGKKDRHSSSIQGIEPGGLTNTQSYSIQEKKVLKAICEILDIDCLGRYESFFDVGGNSMLAASLVLALNAEFSGCLSLSELLQTPPTILSISALISAKMKAHV